MRCTSSFEEESRKFQAEYDFLVCDVVILSHLTVLGRRATLTAKPLGGHLASSKGRMWREQPDPAATAA